MSVPLNDDSHLEYTQDIRRKLVQQLTMPDGKLPEDPKVAKLLLDALKDHDKVTLTLKRIDVDRDVGDQQAQALAQFRAIAEMLGTRDPSRTEEPIGEIPIVDVSQLPHVELVEGELETDSAPLDYDDILNRGSSNQE